MQDRCNAIGVLGLLFLTAASQHANAWQASESLPYKGKYDFSVEETLTNPDAKISFGCERGEAESPSFSVLFLDAAKDGVNRRDGATVEVATLQQKTFIPVKWLGVESEVFVEYNRE